MQVLQTLTQIECPPFLSERRCDYSEYDVCINLPSFKLKVLINILSLVKRSKTSLADNDSS